MPLHSALAKLPARLLSWLRFLPRSWISVYILCGSVDEKSTTRFLLRITAAHSCQGGGGVNDLLESKSQQVHKLLSGFFKETGGYTVYICFL